MNAVTWWDRQDQDEWGSSSSTSLQARSNSSRVRLIETNKSKQGRGRFCCCGFTAVPGNPAQSTPKVVQLGTHLAPSPPLISHTMAVGKVGVIVLYKHPGTHISIRTSVCQKERRVLRKRLLIHSPERVCPSSFIPHRCALLTPSRRVVRHQGAINI